MPYICTRINLVIVQKLKLQYSLVGLITYHFQLHFFLYIEFVFVSKMIHIMNVDVLQKVFPCAQIYEIQQNIPEDTHMRVEKDKIHIQRGGLICFERRSLL